MKLYVAMYVYSYEVGAVVGVFSTKKAAEDYLEEKYKGWGDYQEVFEFELDVGEKD